MNPAATKLLRTVSLLLLAASMLVCAAAAEAGTWTFGPEYLAYTETYEVANRWYESNVYWRSAYLNGAYQFEEFVRRVDYYQGPVTSYGSAQIAGQSLEYINPPHLSLVTTYQRPVYHYGTFTGYEPAPELTKVEDACQVSEGDAYVLDAVVVQSSSGPVLRVTYAYPIYHANPQYGRFLVGQREEAEILPVTTTAAHSSPGTETSPVPLDTALRQISSVEEFSDYLEVAENRYAQDIRSAFELGLIVGRYDDASRYYAPEGIITLGEMVNVLARNYGAASTIQGDEARQYLQELGVNVPSDLDGALSLSQLAVLADQLTSLDLVPKADLLVMRQVLDGALAPDAGTGISRAYAVALYHPSAPAPAPSSTASTAPPPSLVNEPSWSDPLPAPGSFLDPPPPLQPPENAVHPSDIILFVLID